MRARTLLRIASGLMLLHCIGHSFGALSWNQAPNPALRKVIANMISIHFDFMGKSVTIGSFYAGYGYCLIVLLLFITLLLWLLANQPHQQILMLLGFFLLVFGILEWIFFFPLPAIFSTIAGILSLSACNRTKFPNSYISL